MPQLHLSFSEKQAQIRFPLTVSRRTWACFWDITSIVNTFFFLMSQNFLLSFCNNIS